MRIFTALFLGGLLLHTVSYAQDVDIDIAPDGATTTEKLADVERAFKFLEENKAFAHVQDHIRKAVRDGHFSGMCQVITDPKSMTEKDLKDYTGIVERAIKICKAHEKVTSNSTAAAEPEAETIPSDEHTFTFEEFPGYDNYNSSVLRMVYDPKTLVQRVQHSSLCYMHAPVVTQYYSIWNSILKLNPGAPSGHGMIDITAEIATYFKGKDLYEHVFEDKGGDSSSFLYRILRENSTLLNLSPWQSSFEDLAGALRTYGPAMVPAFMVHADFMNASMHHHHGLPDKAHPIDGHSMVLVGVRTDEAGKVYYLLQNWWPGKQFVEVSREYLLASLPPTSIPFQFVETPQYYVPAERHTHSSRMHWAQTAKGIEHAVKLRPQWSSPELLYH